MKRNFIKYSIFFLLSAGVLFLTSCGEENRNTGMIKNKTDVKTEIVKEKNQENIVEFTGVIEGSKKVKLSTKLMGNVTYLPFEAGAEVKEGQIVAKIQSKDIEAKRQQVLANLSAAEAAHTNMERNYNRIKSLYEKESATEKEFDDVTLGYKMTASQVTAAKEMKKEIEDVLSYSVLRAPFNGFIVNKLVQTGDIATPGYPLLIIENFNAFNVVVNVSADYINKLKKGNQVDVQIDAIKSDKIKGEILEVNPGAHPASRQYSIKVKLLISNELKTQIKSGMYARVLISQNENTKILINEKYLVKRGQLVGVYTINRNNEAVLRWLRLGKQFGENFEVLSGLTKGEKIITTLNVQEGQKVEVK